MSRFLGLATLCFLLVLGCKKEKMKDPNPYIRYLGVSSNRLKYGKDTLRIGFAFQDADADLSGTQAFVRDSRFPNDSFFVPFPNIDDQLRDTLYGLDGEAQLTIPPGVRLQIRDSVAPFPPRDHDTFRLSIYVTDRAGNVSNTILTDTLYLNR